MPHVNPPRRRVRDVVGDAALLVLADGKRAVVRPRQARIPLIARRADVDERAVEGREARVADVVRRVREDDRVDDRADSPEFHVSIVYDSFADVNLRIKQITNARVSAIPRCVYAFGRV